MPWLVVPALLLLMLCFLGWLVVRIGEVVYDFVRDRQRRKRARVERELDRQQAELRRTILTLAEQLDGSAHEARKALIRESFLASGQAPDQRR